MPLVSSFRNPDWDTIPTNQISHKFQANLFGKEPIRTPQTNDMDLMSCLSLREYRNTYCFKPSLVAIRILDFCVTHDHCYGSSQSILL